MTHYVLFVIELSTRRVHFAELTPNPDTAWMMQIGWNLTDPVDDFLRDKRHAPVLLAGRGEHIILGKIWIVLAQVYC